MCKLYCDCSGGVVSAGGRGKPGKRLFPECSIIVDRLFCVDMMGFSVGANTN